MPDPALSPAACGSLTLCGEDFSRTLLLLLPLLCGPAAVAVVALAAPRPWFSRNAEFTAGAIKCGKAEAADCAPDPPPEKNTENGVGAALKPFSKAGCAGTLEVSFNSVGAPGLAFADRTLLPAASRTPAFPESAGTAGLASAASSSGEASLWPATIPADGSDVSVPRALSTEAADCAAISASEASEGALSTAGAAEEFAGSSGSLAGTALASRIGEALAVSIDGL